MRVLLGLLTVILMSSFPGVSQDVQIDLEKYRSASEKKWQKDMEAFGKLDASEDYPDNAVLFCGSSSIRLWDTLAEDVAPYIPIQRGFGGSTWSDVAVHTKQLISPHKFQAAVFFLGNDIKGKNDDKSPEEVLGLVRYVFEFIQKQQPETPVFFLPVTPTESRWGAWPKVKVANKMIEQWCESTTHAHFIATAETFLTKDGVPNSDLFINDKLHLNREGYRKWSKLVLNALNPALKNQ